MDPEVTILMGVYNGGAFLEPQLESLRGQSHANWRLIASDDGSTDDSQRVLDRFAQSCRAGQVVRVQGPGQGFARNYLSLLRNLPDAPGWVAFADQDDVWLDHKLKTGVTALAALGEGPALHCGRRLVVAGDLSQPRISPAFPKPPSFRNALVQNIASGNTILVNPAAAALLVAAARKTETVVAHDWWAYQLITGCGGAVLHDDRALILYRQHVENVIGANDGAMARLRRIAMMLRGDFRDWNGINLAALAAAKAALTPEASDLAQGMRQMRDARGALRRVRMLRELGLYRQTWPAHLALYLAAILGKL